MVILGAGYAGMMTAIRLAGKTKKHKVRVTLINAAAHFSERPRLHEVATGNPPRLRPIAQMLEGTTVQFCQGYATKLDAERQKIHLQTTNSEEQIPYDYLVMALGSQVDRDSVPGVRDHAYTLDANGPLTAEPLYERLQEMVPSGGRVVVVGSGPTEIEAAAIQPPQAYLTTIVTRLCMNQLTSARAQRESYIGPWLPEPILTSSDTLFYTSAHHVNQYESISVAFMFLLERLSPAERAVFLLREVFDYEYDEIAAILDKSETACRQLFSRAKPHLTAHRPRFESSSSQHDRLIHRFFQAVEGGDLEGLTRLLAEDVVVWTDGGGKVVAALHPVRGRELAARFMLNSKQLAPGPFVGEMASVNGRSAIILRNQEG